MEYKKVIKYFKKKKEFLFKGKKYVLESIKLNQYKQDERSMIFFLLPSYGTDVVILKAIDCEIDSTIVDFKTFILDFLKNEGIK